MTHPYKTREGGATVTVFVPYDCQNNCPFCINKKEYADCSGFSLDKILDSSQLTSAQAAAYTIDLCHALEELHNLGIVHRDIKPANVMITPENRAVLLDLSIAREISSDQQDTRSLGTVGYAAPEQYGVAQSNRATDLYALGVLLNTMITGVHPAVDIPRGPIRHIVQKATDTQISKRYKSAAAMARALRLMYGYKKK